MRCGDTGKKRWRMVMGDICKVGREKGGQRNGKKK